MPTIWDIILAVIVPVITVFATFIGIVIYRLSKERKLLNFLGVDKNSRRIIIYLSSLFIPRGNAVGFDGGVRSYQGITIPIEEFGISLPLAKSLGIDAFDNIPPILRKPLQEKNTFLRPISIDINASPMKEGDIDFSTRSLITVGSQGYNIVTNYCISHNLCKLQIGQNGTAIEIKKGKQIGEIINRASVNHDIAILEKLVDQSHGNTTIIIAAGLGVIGTMGAIQYMIDNWEKLYKTYQDDEFALVLQFGPAGTMSLNDLLKGEVIRRLPEY
jgi:hypothetical protein